MLINYFRIAIRNLHKYKAYSFINIAGLAIGMACCILILLYVQDELSYDRYHSKADRIYRVLEHVKDGDVGEESASQPFPAGEQLLTDYPHLIEASVRFFNLQAPSITIVHQDMSFNEQRFFFADSSVFRVFDFPLIVGDPETALVEPNTIVMTEETANRYFGNQDPIGKSVMFQGQVPFRVTGILEKVPANSHFQFDMLASFTSLPQIMGRQLQGWYWNPCWTYVLMKENVEPETLAAMFPDFVNQYFPDFIKDKITLYMQPLVDIHLHSHLDYEITANSDITYVYIFIAIAVFVLLIACMNFMNLATARSLNRMQEISMRKVLGAFRMQLMRQFLGESVLMSLLSMIFAISAVVLILPYFNDFTGKEITNLFDTNIVLGVSILALCVGIFAGIYPALFLSGFKPVEILRSKSQRTKGSGLFRKGLVVVQFSISIILIIGTGIALSQLEYLRNKDLGFDKESVVLVPATPGSLARNYPALKERLLQNPVITHVSATEGKLGIFNQTATYSPEGYTERDQLQLPRLIVDFDFMETSGMQMASGRSFTMEHPSDSLGGFIINEALAEFLGWTPDEAIGKKMFRQGDNEVVGVVRDFHYASLHNRIDPFVLQLPRNRGQFNFFIKYLAFRFESEEIPGVLSFVEDVWYEMIPNQPFEYIFLNEELDQQYKAEEKLGVLSRIFSALAIFVACLGLYALAAFTAEQRTKEIGIRKVMGASVPRLLILVSKEFALLVLLANIIGIPAAYFFMRAWLQTFAYRMEMGPDIFIASGLIAFVIAFLTVSYRSFKVAISNPVESLKYE